jgi:radical SAM superfamily enzyme YgiQ (UPF0313 family)
MKERPVIFIAKKEYDNLGTGYMSAVLYEAGYKTITIDLCDGREQILDILKRADPLIVGFSVIYQYHIDQFIDLVRFLRKGGIGCHFTAGGHYASLRYEELIKLIPELDSVVRFEGEYTIRELADCLYEGKGWKTTESIAYHVNGTITLSPARALERDLDNLPYPLRTPLQDYAPGRKFATVLAGRGCQYDCSFCNLREFYLPFRGAARRVRRPERVVEEMLYLHDKMDCSIFLFQDDDFPVKQENRSLWIERFCDEIERSAMMGKIMWKINCRPDEIEERLFARMKSTGLFLVFIGIEDGTDDGLRRLNKHMTVAECMKGIDILKKLGIGFDYGFMLFQPSTTFGSLNGNLDFLGALCGDGYSPVAFLKMMPYYDTPVERELMSQGRIKGKPGYHDYDFPDENMNRYFEFITDCFLEWTRSRDGVANISKWARNYISVCSHYNNLRTALPVISRDLRKVLSNSNRFMIDSMKELATLFESGRCNNINSVELKRFRKNIKTRHEKYKSQIKSSMITLITLIEIQRKQRQPIIPVNPASSF